MNTGTESALRVFLAVPEPRASAGIRKCCRAGFPSALLARLAGVLRAYGGQPSPEARLLQAQAGAGDPVRYAACRTGGWLVLAAVPCRAVGVDIPAVPGGHQVRGYRHVRFEEDMGAVVGDVPFSGQPAVGALRWSGRLGAGGAFHHGLDPVGLLPGARRIRWPLPVSVGVG